jgi:Histidine kinase-like ATPase domain
MSTNLLHGSSMHVSRTGRPAQPSLTSLREGVERIELAPRPTSAATARKLATAFAEQHHLGDDLADSICLVVSELVTNAVLHARTAVVLTLELWPGVVRISVRDGSLASLAVRNYSTEAITGRGLGVVEALSRAWGAVADGDGKLVWAEFNLDGAETGDVGFAPYHVDSPQQSAPAGGGELRTVRFPGVPVATYLALQEHNDALYRELELLAIERDSSAPAERPPRLRAVARELLGPRFRGARNAYREAIAVAEANRQAAADLESSASAEMIPLARTYVELLDETDGYCREGLLLTMPPDPRVTDLRHWFVDQMAVQLLDGQPPTPPSL